MRPQEDSISEDSEGDVIVEPSTRTGSTTTTGA